MKIKELIEYLKTLDQEARIFLQYDSFMWHDLEPDCIEHVDRDDAKYREARELGATIKDFKIELS